MNLKKINFLIFISLFMALINSDVSAQVLPPSNVDPGSVNRFNEQNNILDKDKTIENQDENFENNASPQKNTPATYKQKTIKLNKFNFYGNNLYSTKQLEKITNKYIGTNVTINDLTDITSQITQLYHANGYITSFAYLPPQKVENGNIEIRLIEGKIGNIEIEGNKWTRTNYIKKNILKSNELNENKIFNVKNLRKSLGEINNKEYLRGQVIIQKGADDETSDIILNIKDRFPIDFEAGWDNRGRALIGRKRATLTLSNENLTGLGDTLYADTSFASGTFGVGTGYSIPLGPFGTEIRTGYSYSNVELGGELKASQYKGSAHNFNMGLIQNIYQTHNFNINSDLNFDMLHAETKMLQNIPVNKYDIRALRLGINAIKDDNQGRWVSRFQVSTGLPIMGATTESSNGIGSGKFVKLNSSLVRLQSLPWNSTGIFKIIGQYSPNALLPAEQLQIGGMYSVRGFEEGLLLGDVGYNIILEARTPIPFMPERLNVPYWHNKSVNIPLKDNVKFAAFYDQGFAKSIHRGEKTNYTNFLQSVGVGLRCYLTKFISANFDLGVPLGRDRYDNQRAVKFHFTLSSDIL